MVYTKHFTIRKLKHLRQAKDYIENAGKTLLGPDESNFSHLDNLFPYITNDDKTASKQLVSGHRIIDVYNAANEFIWTKELHGRRDGRLLELNPKTNKLEFKMESLETATGGRQAVLGHHLIQSFSPEDDLTPEQIHEIGRQTVLEFTGGEHEFVIATHIDKEHIHNHIIINSTNAETGRAMNWKVVKGNKGKNFDVSKSNFEKVSDKIASQYGAKIIEKSPKNSHKKYTMWQTENIFKTKIKSRLDFLLLHSHSIEDFKIKADALNLEVNFDGRWATYKLLDEAQIKVTRGRSLSKSQPEKYNKEQIEKTLLNNAGRFSVDEILEKYEETISRKEEDYDYQVTVESWQISHKTEKGYYLNVDFGFENSGKLFIGSYKMDALDDGDYQLFIKRNDRFYFMDDTNSERNRYMTGETLVKQLKLYNGHVPLKKEPIMRQLSELVEAINFLASNEVKEGRQLSLLETKLEQAYQEAVEKVGELDTKLIELQQLSKLLLASEKTEEKQEIKQKIKSYLSDIDMDELTLKDVERELSAISISRDQLKEKLVSIVKDVNQVHQIQAVTSNYQEKHKKPTL
ncbi:relaxase/mobilization nuclease domain-containing protein [uncultured Vagococcus sp.]|uniref:relaxase/mobilization nuclease domain-containing protein n=1 Tax=uncultured Vagococcus sp. TaxID=189676 RepID=UPI002583AE36|nr:relaxase/mobilization nuclease domain-containing protein [uncultured Vagococcus sp.]